MLLPLKNIPKNIKRLAPESTRPMLELEGSTKIKPDSILNAVVATTPTTDDIRKWLSVDPLSDKYPDVSPYAKT